MKSLHNKKVFVDFHTVVGLFSFHVPEINTARCGFFNARVRSFALLLFLVCGLDEAALMFSLFLVLVLACQQNTSPTQTWGGYCICPFLRRWPYLLWLLAVSACVCF